MKVIKDNNISNISNSQNISNRSGMLKIYALGFPILIVCTLAALLGSGVIGGNSAESKVNKNYILQPAVRQAFVITVEGKGHLQSLNNVTLSSQVSRGLKIVKLVPEGSKVKKGDIVCELDKSEVLERLTKQELDLREAEADFGEAQEKLSLQQDQNDSDIAKAELEWKLAVLDLKKYEDGEFIQEQKQIKGDILLKEEDLTRNRESLDFTKRMVKRGYSKQADLETAQLAVSKAELGLESEKEKLRVLEKYTYERKIAELKSKSEETARELRRAKRKAELALEKSKAAFESYQLALNLETTQLDFWKDQLVKCELVAPQDGEVIYANERARRYGSDQYSIRVGTNIYESTPIIRLPDLSVMKIDAKIHESRFALLEVNQPVDIEVEAYSDEPFEGIVHKISAVPVDGAWPNTDIKQYDVEIKLLDPSVEGDGNTLRPGLSAKFKIVATNRPNILQVPIQSVVGIGDDYYSWVIQGNDAKRRLIKVGDTNDSDIEIVDGIEEDEMVVMNPRSQFADDISALQLKEDEREKNPKEEEKEDSKAEKESSKKTETDSSEPKTPKKTTSK